MLRQVFLYHNGKIIFRYDFAQGLDKGEVDNLFSTTLVSYIEEPIEGQPFNKPLSDYQAHFMSEKGVFFLFITDMADRPKTIKEEIKRASSLFFKNFDRPEDIEEDSMEK